MHAVHYPRAQGGVVSCCNFNERRQKEDTTSQLTVCTHLYFAEVHLLGVRKLYLDVSGRFRLLVALDADCGTWRHDSLILSAQLLVVRVTVSVSDDKVIRSRCCKQQPVRVTGLNRLLTAHQHKSIY